MLQIENIDKLRKTLWQMRLDGKTIGFVPTMGNLHEGHLQLVDIAKQHADIVVVSIFVNPLQFGPSEDYQGYPRTAIQDRQQLVARDCDILFSPDVDTMYPDTQVSNTLVQVPSLNHILCGVSRPLFFDGVATVVTKLFGIVQPDYAVFGLKDYQQYLVIKQLTEDLCLPVTIVGAPIARADNGLALSSRNGYLSTQELNLASRLYQTLLAIQSRIQQGEHTFTPLEKDASKTLTQAGFSVDYFNICRQTDLQPAQPEDTELVILVAAHLGKARLIDNVIFTIH